MNLFPRLAVLFLVAASLLLPVAPTAQTAALHGQVTDPSGAVIPGAAISLAPGDTPAAEPIQTQSGADGQYSLRSLAPGSYTVSVTASLGFAPLTISKRSSLAAGQSKIWKLPLAIAVEQQQVRSR